MYNVKALACAALAIALLSCARVAPAQLSISIGVAPVCPYGYFDYAPYNCAPYGYYGPDWFNAESLLAPAAGTTAPPTSTAMSTTATILVTAIEAPFQVAEKNSSTTSTAMRRATAEATQATASTMAAMNTRCPAITAAATARSTARIGEVRSARHEAGTHLDCDRQRTRGRAAGEYRRSPVFVQHFAQLLAHPQQSRMLSGSLSLTMREYFEFLTSGLAKRRYWVSISFK